VVGREAHVGERRRRGLAVPVTELVGRGGDGVRRDVVQDVEVGTLGVGVGGVDVRVDLEVHGIGLGLVVTGVVVVPGQGEALAGDELAGGLERAVADRR